jgi:hypothetical protein
VREIKICSSVLVCLWRYFARNLPAAFASKMFFSYILFNMESLWTFKIFSAYLEQEKIRSTVKK